MRWALVGTQIGCRGQVLEEGTTSDGTSLFHTPGSLFARCQSSVFICLSVSGFRDRLFPRCFSAPAKGERGDCLRIQHMEKLLFMYIFCLGFCKLS